VLSLLPSTTYLVSFEKENIDVNMWLSIVQTLKNLIPEQIDFRTSSTINYYSLDWLSIYSLDIN
jgi:hypothetical protein